MLQRPLSVGVQVCSLCHSSFSVYWLILSNVPDSFLLSLDSLFESASFHLVVLLVPVE